MKRLGIDCGASTIKLAYINDNSVIFTDIKEHFGSPVSVLKNMLCDFIRSYPDSENAVTALCGICTPSYLNECTVNEIPSITEGIKMICPDAESIIEIGSRNAKYIALNDKQPPVFSVNEQCAGGTGSFFENQMSRLGLKIEDYSSLVENSESVPRISGRCAVFAKTDIIHHQQEGIDISDILLGLCYAMIKNYKAVIVRNLPVKKPVVLCGGIAMNAGVIKAVKNVFDLNDSQLIIPEYSRFISAIGAALLSDNTTAVSVYDRLCVCSTENTILRLEPFSAVENIHMTDPICDGALTEKGTYLGIDIGSTSTDLVLTDENGKLIDYQYLRTSGNSEQAVRSGLANIKKRFGDLKICGVGVTGSGRERIGRMLGADAIRDEITAQAKAASAICPDADTVFEIGGQDSKFIALKNGMVSDFRMNKICSAGTGSLAEEQADRLGISISEFGELALTSKAPADLGERCTVFIESAVSMAAANGVSIADITAGICWAIVKNYLHKVAQINLIGEKIVLQGGIAYNPGIVAAFKSRFGDKLTVSPYFSISGAYGAALLTAENMNGKATQFKGFDFDKQIEKATHNSNVKLNRDFYDRAYTALTDGYDGKIDPDKKTIGVPLVLVMHKLFPMVNAYFKALGFNVLLSSPTNPHTIELAQKYAQGEVCYPVKLIYGHIQELVEKNADYIFIPSIHTMKHEYSGVKHNYGCVYMQTAGKLIAKNLGLEEKGIKLLTPVFDLDFGKKAMASAMVQTGVELGFLPPKCMAALITGSAAVKKYAETVENMGAELLSALKPDEKVLVLITRPYDISDPVLNMGIPQLLLERGCKLITLDHLPGHSLDISEEYPNIYWPFGQHIISGAKLIKNHPNLYAVYLTNHGCGPDTMLSHLFRREMGNKPYLQIEVDEHDSPVGVITRIDAFLNSLKQQNVQTPDKDFDIKNVVIQKYKQPYIKSASAPLYIPNFGLYSVMLKEYLSEIYYRNVCILPEISEINIQKGREFTVTKEYITFTAMLGSIVERAEKESDTFDVLLTENEGSEADGVFARVISALIEEKGLSEKVNIISPMLEHIPEQAENFEKLFRGILTADIIYSIPVTYRSKLIPDHIPDESELLKLAETAGKYEHSGKNIRIVGTPMSIYSLGTEIINYLEEKGYDLKYQPMSEYLCFLWKDNGVKCSKQIKLMEKVSALLNNNSGFSGAVSKLIKAADEEFKGFAGGNGRYRYAKIITAEKCDAIIEIVPRYENTAFIHDLSGIKTTVPLHRISIDGDGTEHKMTALHSFLFYI
ncbi:MAG: acyl-CoA dehydratase activase [Clostridium sp.]|nr:acyl-CoA dehydratase activase [Clostridium sp.]